MIAPFIFSSTWPTLQKNILAPDFKGLPPPVFIGLHSFRVSQSAGGNSDPPWLWYNLIPVEKKPVLFFPCKLRSTPSYEGRVNNWFWAGPPSNSMWFDWAEELSLYIITTIFDWLYKSLDEGNLEPSTCYSKVIGLITKSLCLRNEKTRKE